MMSFVIKSGGDLLSHHNGSTIGAEGLNFSVRNGKRCNTLAITTLFSFSSTIGKRFLRNQFYVNFIRINLSIIFKKKGSYRAISTTQLHTLLHFHL